MFGAWRACALTIGLLAGTAWPSQHHEIAVRLQPPAYAKWGRIAMERTAQRYRMPIVDYLHVGRRQLSPGIAEEKFKLWLRDANREFGVFVTIRFETVGERILAVEFDETATR
ncbi:DUF3889 domain-containing protein [Cohnella sp. GCM10027633]|uniref:DUF3889 domain-containing protein n=1 Tax=unclassified Cohnella TaxID=2636738 RepID=UPI00364465BF